MWSQRNGQAVPAPWGVLSWTRSIAQGSAPLLLIHGDADHQIRLRHSQRLEVLAGGRAKLVVVAGATHDSVLSRPLVQRETLAWLQQHL